jgi:hypothetical protein
MSVNIITKIPLLVAATAGVLSVNETCFAASATSKVITYAVNPETPTKVFA